MGKIGIMTFHTAYNYGAVLQAYALQNTLIELGKENEIIDYKCPTFISDYSTIKVNKGIKPFIKSVLNSLTTVKLKKQYDEFAKHNLILSKEKYNTIDELRKANLKYDMFITGSDQIFDPKCAGFDPSYFLTFVNSEKRKISYAASFDKMELPDNLIDEYKSRIERFDYLSCREQEGADILKPYVNNKIYVNADPTLLLSSKEWDKIADEVEFSNYIFVYPVGVSKKMIDFAKKIAKKNNWKVVYLDRNLKWHDPEVTFLQIAGPSQFIGLIRNANMVVTNSFHGAVFSIIYHKQLYVEFKENGNGNARVQNLMTLLGVPKHAMERLNPNDDYPNDEDWDKIDNNILKERKHAMEYLKNALE